MGHNIAFGIAAIGDEKEVQSGNDINKVNVTLTNFSFNTCSYKVTSVFQGTSVCLFKA